MEFDNFLHTPFNGWERDTGYPSAEDRCLIVRTASARFRFPQGMTTPSGLFDRLHADAAVEERIPCRGLTGC